MGSVQSALDSLLGGTDGSKDEADRAALLNRLKADLAQFGKDLLEHLNHEEFYFATPVARKVCQVQPQSRGFGKSWYHGTGWKGQVDVSGQQRGVTRVNTPATTICVPVGSQREL